MAYKIINKNSSSITLDDDIGNQLLSSSSAGAAGSKFGGVDFYEIEPAEALDIILDDTHSDFNTFEDIGKIKVRLLYSNKNSGINDNGESLLWAKPIDSNFKRYPLLHEIVLTAYYVTRENSIDDNTTNTIPVSLYYFNSLNALNSPHHNALLNISLSTKKEEDNLVLGNKFKLNNKIRPLKQDEGDISFEGRLGQSIKFGSDSNIINSNIKIRAGQQTTNISENIIEPIEEDINNDSSSIYLLSNQETDIELLNNDGNNLFKNYPSSLVGNQIVINSDRVIINSKFNELIFNSNNGILLNTNKDIVLNSNNDNIQLDGNKIILGKENIEQSVLGNTLKKILEELIKEINSITVPTPAGPSGVPNNKVKFQAIKLKLENFLSKKNYLE